MKYDIHKFEQLHFLITQFNKAGVVWFLGINPRSREAADQYMAGFNNTLDKSQDVDFASCPVDALALSYQRFKEYNDIRSSLPEDRKESA